jgi:hypothetical protein
MNTGQLLTLLRSVTHQVAVTAAEVHSLVGGNYRKYLEITNGDEHRR